MKARPAVARELHDTATRNIRAARAAAGKTRLQVAISAGCDPGTVVDAENGTASLESKVRVGIALGLPPAKLFKK